MFLTLGLMVSCKTDKTTAVYDYDLKATGKIKSFELDADVRYNAFYLYTFTDNSQREYLSFLNYRGNQILFYDLSTGNLEKKVNLYAEGPNGIVQASGYFVQDWDNLYISSYAYEGLIKVDTTGRIIQKIPYGTTDEGYKVLPAYTPSSHPYIAPVFVDGKMFITQPAVERFHPLNTTPLSVAIDTVQQIYKGFPLTYGVLTEEEKEANDKRFSRIYDGGRFVYSFYVDEDIVVASSDHSQLNTIKVKSQYIDSPTGIQKDTEKGAQLNLEQARYGDLIYDPYQEVYYRFAYPNVELDDNINWLGKAVYGRKKFSVIILNKDFEIIGETLFPEAIYNSYVFFVHKDGLYISRDYQMNYDQSEDYMTFERFTLEKK